jgi:hypothetical protein
MLRMSPENPARGILAFCRILARQNLALREWREMRECDFCAGFSPRIPQNPAYKRWHSRAFPHIQYPCVCVAYMSRNACKTGNLPQNCQNDFLMDPKTHHKSMSKGSLNAENSQLSNGIVFIPVRNLFSDCVRIYCSGVSYP